MPYKNGSTGWKQWSKTESGREACKRYRLRRKMEILNAYGGACACCGETEPMFLSIDHINGGGKQHMKQIQTQTGTGFYCWLKANNFPADFQVLCHNCNRGKYFNGGVCPHQSKGKAIMAKMKANPLGLLMMEIIGNGVAQKALGMDGGVDSDPSFRGQVPVKDGLAGQDTFKIDASKPSSRAPVELRRMHLAGGEDVGEGSEVLKGSNMFNEFGGGTGGSAGKFTANKNK